MLQVFEVDGLLGVVERENGGEVGRRGAAAFGDDAAVELLGGVHGVGMGAVDHLAATFDAGLLSRSQIGQADDDIWAQSPDGVDVLGGFQLAESEHGRDGDGVGCVVRGTDDGGDATRAHDKSDIVGETGEVAESRFMGGRGNFIEGGFTLGVLPF